MRSDPERQVCENIFSPRVSDEFITDCIFKIAKNIFMKFTERKLGLCNM